MNDIPKLCAEATRAWNHWLMAGVEPGDLQAEAIGRMARVTERTGMSLDAVLERGEQELRAQMASEG